jgi:3-methylcrotonyl-CoA carboxylase alpha subunit
VFRTVLIANRGEIACRVIETCRRMGLRSVAVYSEADRGALHTQLADAALPIGPAEAARSYLDVEAIVAAAERAGADAVHPGYGFLSERAVLPRRLAEAGIGWIGPHIGAIERMGSKRAAKAVARAAGVACVPGYDGAEQSDACLAEAAARIGYPILVKASAGGGGRGMRRVETPAALAAALAEARAEAEAAFGSAALLLEKLVARPRHLEVQLAGDKHGNLVHLFERECSVQRHYQKVLEEAPAPCLSDGVRARLYDAALRLGRAMAYDSLGTAEFILDEASEEPWFLEMNTRLQVEHPVTELVTGIDLVEWQIRAAAGEVLDRPQSTITLRGHAIEARLCAEDPALDYRPATGTILRFEPPEGENLRVDTGIASGAVVTPYYDSLLAKVIAHGADRAEALRRCGVALDRLVLLGVVTNQALLRDVLGHPAFEAGRLTTRFLAEAFPDGWQPGAAEAADAAEYAALALWLAAGRAAATGPGAWGRIGPFRILTPAGHPGRAYATLTGAAGAREVTLTGTAERFAADGKTVTASFGEGRISIRHEERAHSFAWAQQGHDIWLQAGSRARLVRITAADAVADTATETAGSLSVLAPMPGLVAAVAVAAGQVVEKGEICVVMEAMKVVLRLPAPVSGRVARLLCGVGETVGGGAVLVELEAE